MQRDIINHLENWAANLRISTWKVAIFLSLIVSLKSGYIIFVYIDFRADSN